MSQRFNRIISGHVMVILAALLGMAFTIWSTRLGPGVGGDATIYLTSAQNLAKGIGLGLVQADGSFRLLPYSAPLFPLVLTPFAAFGLNLTPVSRWLNIQLFGVIILLVGFVSLKITNNKWTGAIPAWLVAVSPILLPVYSWAMAEPLTLALGFGGLCIVFLHLEAVESKSKNWLVPAGLLLGLAVTARYSAAAFLAAGVLMCLVWMDEAFVNRIKTVFLLGVVGILPIAGWIFVQVGQTASVSSRSLLTLQQMTERFTLFWPQLNAAVLVWLVPASFLDSAPYPLWLNQALPLAAVLVLLGVSFYLFSKRERTGISAFARMLWLFSAIYLLVILLVYLTTYPPITIDSRMLSPLHTAVIWLAGLVLAESINRTSKIVPVIMAALVMVFIGWYGIRTLRIVQQNAAIGLGYNSVAWQTSPLIARVRQLDANKGIITNEPMAVLYLTGRLSNPLAEIYFDKPVAHFSRYGDGQPGPDPSEEEFKKGNSLLVLFDSLISQLQPIYGADAQNRANSLINQLDIVVSSDDGVILEYPAAERPPM